MVPFVFTSTSLSNIMRCKRCGGPVRSIGREKDTKTSRGKERFVCDRCAFHPDKKKRELGWFRERDLV